MFLNKHAHDYIVYITLPFCEVHVNEVHYQLVTCYLGMINKDIVVIAELKSDVELSKYPQYLKTIYSEEEDVTRHFAIFKPLPKFSKLMKAMYDDNFDMSAQEVYQVVKYSGLVYNLRKANGKIMQDMLILALVNHPVAYKELYDNIKDFHDEGECPVRHIGDDIWETDIPLVVIQNYHYFKNLNIQQWKKQQQKI